MPSDPILRDFEQNVGSRPDAVLVASPSREARAREIDALARSLAARISRLPGDPARPIALRVPNGPAFLAAAIAALRAGRAALLVDRGAPVMEERRAATALGAAASLRAADGFERDAAAFEIEPNDAAPVPLPTGTSWIKLTSGSAGEPAGVAFASAALVADDEALATAMDLGGSDRLLASIPWSHSYGLSSLVLPCLRRGMTLVLPDAPGPFASLEAARRLSASFFPTAPAFLEGLLRLADPPAWPSSIRTVVSAGAPLGAGTARSFRERFGRAVHAFYGASEVGGICYDREGGAAERGTVGVPIPGVRVDLVSGEAEGRVRVASPAAGLARVPEDDGRLRNGLFLTGDRGRFEANGELALLGRADALINVRGRKVDPEEVENVLASLDGVREAAVIAVRDPRGAGEILRAVVACSPAAVTPERVVSWCREKLAPHKVPRSVLLVEAIPRNDRGKIDRDALRRLGE